MSHDKHMLDGLNKDLEGEYRSKEEYLALTSNFKTKLPKIIVDVVDGVSVVREDLLGFGGTKARAAEFLFSTLDKETVVYCVPRVGHAGFAIMRLAKLYGKKVVLFMPSSKEISDHQAATIAQGPEDVIFHRIAAMPNLNRLAKKWSEENGAEFLPFGLNHPYVIAGFVRACDDLLKEHKEPSKMWTAVSTGVLTRGLQIGFPNCEFHGVAVARNMKEGEVGRCEIISEPLEFVAEEPMCNRPPFDSVATYDSKVWKYIPKDTNGSTWFWNVAGEIHCPVDFDKSKVNSYRDW